MNAPRFPEATEVRAGMRRIAVANAELRRLQEAQIAQSLFGATIGARLEVAAAVVEALGSVSDALTMYLILMGLDAGDTVEPAIEGTHG